MVNWNSPFPFFHIYSNFNRTFCKQTVETLIRRRILGRLIWVCTICLCPTKRIYGLKEENGNFKTQNGCKYLFKTFGPEHENLVCMALSSKEYICADSPKP